MATRAPFASRAAPFLLFGEGHDDGARGAAEGFDDLITTGCTGVVVIATFARQLGSEFVAFGVAFADVALFTMARIFAIGIFAFGILVGCMVMPFVIVSRMVVAFVSVLRGRGLHSQQAAFPNLRHVGGLRTRRDQWQLLPRRFCGHEEESRR